MNEHTQDQLFNLVVSKDCSFVLFTGQGFDVFSLTYRSTSPAEVATYSLPTVSDPYCQINYEINVWDNITLSTLGYTDSSRFGLDPSTTAVHSDLVSRTESYLI